MAGTAFALILGGTILGAIVRSRLPEHHLDRRFQGSQSAGDRLVATPHRPRAWPCCLPRPGHRSSTPALRSPAGEPTSAELDDVLEEYGPRAQPSASSCATRSSADRSIWRDDAAAAAARLPLGRSTTRAPFTCCATCNRRRPPRRRSIRAPCRSPRTSSKPVSVCWPAAGLGLPTPFMVVLVLWMVFLFTTFSMSSRSRTRRWPSCSSSASCRLRGDLPHPRTRPAVRRIDAGFQRQPARGPDTDLKIAA